jgi:hypothetical protein
MPRGGQRIWGTNYKDAGNGGEVRGYGEDGHGFSISIGEYEALCNQDSVFDNIILILYNITNPLSGGGLPVGASVGGSRKRPFYFRGYSK